MGLDAFSFKKKNQFWLLCGKTNCKFNQIFRTEEYSSYVINNYYIFSRIESGVEKLNTVLES
jgi:hypothetical protein